MLIALESYKNKYKTKMFAFSNQTKIKIYEKAKQKLKSTKCIEYQYKINILMSKSMKNGVPGPGFWDPKIGSKSDKFWGPFRHLFWNHFKLVLAPFGVPF